ncbi:MAG: TerB family tellurite resistance protein [Leptolyngbyaceae cyanobacterium RM2_2_4]|nr:TerB family tellurite resistance protein [Leptolyngbyaceae cyanobacterium RM2_2_4]
MLGSAWVDGRLDPGEMTYLNRLLEREGLSHDAYLKNLLETPVSRAQTEVWMAQYLLQSNEAERQALLGSIGNVLMADDQIAPT